MNIEILIHKKRSLQYMIKQKQDEESIKLLRELLSEYYRSIDICEHNTYIDNGYYRYRNNDLYLTDREHAEFRNIICPICNKQINLIKTEDSEWDTKILGEKITISTLFKCNHKQVNTDLLVTTIKLLKKNLCNQEYCGHLEFINNGYYTDSGIVQKSIRGRADFRVVTCMCCGKSYVLPKTSHKHWDVSIQDNPICVYDADDEKSKQYLITM